METWKDFNLFCLIIWDLINLHNNPRHEHDLTQQQALPTISPLHILLYIIIITLLHALQPHPTTIPFPYQTLHPLK
jgi:hypothetical protein